MTLAMQRAESSTAAIDKPMELFLSSIRSERTREGYSLYFKKQSEIT